MRRILIGTSALPDSPDDSKSSYKGSSRSRLFTVLGLFILCFAVLSARLIDVSLLRDGGEPSITRAGSDRPGATGRADILDRNGVLLATTLRTPSLYANPRVLLDPEEAAKKLTTVLPDLSYNVLIQKLISKRSFAWLKRGLTPLQQHQVNSLGIPGLGFLDEYRRIYPQADLTSHIVGFCGIDNVGLSGIESRYNAELTAPDRLGQAISLSLDIRVQNVLHNELSEAVKTFQAVGAAGVVMDVESGEILAMVSLPDFDPNRFSEANAESRFNRASLGIYEMGSTFKAFTVAAALDTGIINLKSRYDATNPLRVARYWIRDDHAKNRWLSVPEIFIYSSNIGAAKMALDLGGDRQKAFLDKLGLLSPSTVELPEVAKPMWPQPWREDSTMTVGFGHGIAVSPIKIAAAIASLVNGGYRIDETLIRGKSVSAKPGDRVKSVSAKPGDRVVSAHTSKMMRALLRLVVTDGTGSQAEAVGYSVGGKTGTAEKPGKRGYRRDALISSFVGVFPSVAPRFLVLAVLDEPKGTKATHGFAGGGWTAAPTVSRVISKIGPMLDVMPIREKDAESHMILEISSEEENLEAF